MNAQEIFETIVDHLIAQGRQSKSPESESCLYRSPDGLKCAVGILIPDEVYTPDMELKSLYTLLDSFRDILPAAIKEHQVLLSQLQGVHDTDQNWDSRGFKISQAIKVAKAFKLDYSKYRT